MRLSGISKLVGGLLIGASFSLVAVWQYALSNITIGGSTYTEIAEAKDLVADVLPPPQYIIEPYLIATLALESPATAPMRQAESITLKAEYDQRHRHWSNSKLDSEARDLLLGDAHRPAEAFWKLLLEDFYPALITGDESRASKTYKVLSEHYAQHRSAVDKVVLRATSLVHAAEAKSEQLRQSVGLLTSIFSVVGLGLVCTFVWWLCVNYSVPIERLQTAMEDLSSGNFAAEIPYTSRSDEIGGMARTLLVFRGQGRRKTELARQNQQLNDALRERTTALEQTLDHMAQGIVLIREGKISVCNQNAIELLEVENEAAAGELLVGTFQPGSETDIFENRNLPLNQMRSDFVCPSGRSVEIRRCSGSTVGDVYTISDVSALKQRQEQLEKALATASNAIDARSRFFSTMSHEMRTPLNGVIGSLELLGGQSLLPEQRELVEIATKCCDALLAQFDDVLDFSKIEAGKLELSPAPTNIRELVNSAIAVMMPVAAHAQTKLQSDVIGDVPAAILADGIRLRQVLLNFLSNALKFTRRGSVSVRIRRTGGTAESPEIEFAVIDTGPGIARERLPKLFKEYSMARSVTVEISGTGLGLAISKRLIDAMGGTVGVDSVEGLGSVFWFKVALPVVDVSSQPSPGSYISAGGDKPKLRILLVDDNQTNRLIGQRLLARDGHFVETAKNGRDAVQAAATGTFDLILMDVSMPEMDGNEATRQIRELPEPQRSVPIIALTANAVRGDRERFLAAGMDDYLSKPLRLAELRERLTAIGSRTTQPVAQPTPPEEKPVLDMDVLDGVSGGDRAVIAELLGIYCNEIGARLSEFTSALEENNVQALKDVAHAMAGASSSAGAVLLAAEAREIERAVLELNYHSAFLAARNVPVSVRRTLDACRNFIDGATARDPYPPAAA